MSGGYFDYKQYHIDNIAYAIEQYIEKCMRKEEREWGITDKDGNYNPYIYEESEEILAEFRKAVKFLHIASTYAQRIDWYLSGDEGEDSFFERLKEELQIHKEHNLEETI